MFQTTSKESIIVIISGTLILIILGGVIFSILLIHQRRHRKNLFEKQSLKSQFTQTLLQTQLEIQEQTLQNISQEIHDNTSQLLGLIKLNLATTKAADDKAQQKITDAHQLTEQVINSIRQMSHTLDSGFVARIGLPEAIRYQLQLIQKTEEFKTDLDVHGEEQKPDTQKELILFRMVQESLNNIIKHANATKINVVLNYSPEQLIIIISDNGSGFEQTPGKNNGIGIQNMHNRAKMIGATLNIESVLNKGTCTTVTLPL